MHLAFGECDEMKRKGLESMGGVRYRVQINIKWIGVDVFCVWKMLWSRSEGVGNYWRG